MCFPQIGCFLLEGRKPPSLEPPDEPDLSLLHQESCELKVRPLKIYALFYKIAQRETLFPLLFIFHPP